MNDYYIIPKDIENLQLPSPELVTYYQDLDNRCIWLEEEIADETLEIGKKIIAWNREDRGLDPEQRKPIKIFFFSPGGSLDVYRTLGDIIRLSDTPVYGYNMGVAYSAAAFMFLYCHKRYMLPTASFLFHNGSAKLNGDYDQIIASVVEYQNQVSELSSVIIENTLYTEEEVSEKITGEWYIRKDEALEKEVCHSIIDDMNLLL
jgi:ATP-dependent protease ClpP protease subunit